VKFIETELLKNNKRSFKLLKIKTLSFWFFLILLSLFFKSKEIFLGVVIGGGVSLGNFIVLEKIGETIFFKNRPNKMLVIPVYLIKIIILLGLLFILITKEIINPLAFIIGFSLIFLIIIVDAVCFLIKSNMG